MRLTCGFLFTCTGYYRYDEGYTPEFAGSDRFKGQIVHPQHWTDDVDYAGKRVVVIGSGATAVTLVPAMAEQRRARDDAPALAHLHRLAARGGPDRQLPAPGAALQAGLRARALEERASSRWPVFQLSRRRPKLAKALLRKGVERQLPAGFDIDKHFKPTYNPWDQRLCLVPDGDLFEALCDGRASIVTDRIETFTETGCALESGDELEADLIVTATGLNLMPLGGIQLAVDGNDVEIPETMGYKGMMLSGVPNLAVALGYTNASWTLKCDLTCEYVCRLLKHMDEHGYRQCTPENRDPSVTPEPFIDFNSGYVLRAIDQFPKQGSKPPWRLYQNYARDILALKLGDARRRRDGVLEPRAAGRCPREGRRLSPSRLGLAKLGCPN